MESLLKPDRGVALPDAPLTITEGRPWPMGAHRDGNGVNFAVFSANAQAMDLCLFDDAGTREVARLRLPGHTGDIWGYQILLSRFPASGLDLFVFVNSDSADPNAIALAVLDALGMF